MLQRFFERIIRKNARLAHQISWSPINELLQTAVRTTADFIGTLENRGEIMFFSDRTQVQEYAVSILRSSEQAKSSVIEFGVHRGASLRFFARKLPNSKIFGFDSFSGLTESFGGVDSSGIFDRGGKQPRLLPKNLVIVPGLVQDTWSDFEEMHSDAILLYHFDLDVYEPTKYLLSRIKHDLKAGQLLLFDELVGNPFWQDTGEYLALKEELSNDRYQFIAFGPNQALLRIL